jgi:hypothetical protein
VPAEHAGPLGAVLGRLLVKDPAQRPDAAALARELRAAALTATPGAPVADDPSGAGAREHPATERVPPKGGGDRAYRDTERVPPPKPRTPRRQPKPAPEPKKPAPGRRPAPGPRRWAATDRLTAAALFLAIAGAVAYIVGGGLDTAPGKSAAVAYVNDLIPFIAAIIALVRPGLRRPLLPFVLGLSFLCPAGVAYDILAIFGYHALSGGRSAHARENFLANSLGDIAGAAALAILVIVIRRIASRERLGAPRGIPALLLAGPALAWLGWVGVWARNVYVQDSGDAGRFLAADYPFALYAVAGLAAVVFLALFGLGLRARLAGGVALLAMTVSMLLDFGQALTLGWRYSGAEVAVNVIAALLMLATAVLAIRYAARGRIVA